MTSRDSNPDVFSDDEIADRLTRCTVSPKRGDHVPAFADTWPRVEAHLDGVTKRGRTFGTGARTLRRAAYAAVALTVMLIGVMFVGRWPNASDHPVATRTYATRAAQRATVDLPDGSRIIMAPRTTLTLATDLSTRARTATLVGEAQFNISNTHAPFTVRTGRVLTRVLGTIFVVRRYAADTASRVLVTAGKVTVRGPGTMSTLVAGTSGDFTDSTAVTSAHIDSTVVTDWSRGLLIFTHAQVSVVFESLTRWYGYEFHLADSALAHKYVTATFMIDDRTQTMALLQSLLNVRLTFKDSVVTLSPLRDTPGSPVRTNTPREKDVLSPSFHLEIGR